MKSTDRWLGRRVRIFGWDVDDCTCGTCRAMSGTGGLGVVVDVGDTCVTVRFIGYEAVLIWPKEQCQLMEPAEVGYL